MVAFARNFFRIPLLVGLLGIFALTAIPGAGAEFTLVRRAPVPDVDHAEKLAVPPAGPSVETTPDVHHTHPWRAALETFVINAGVWAFDRYVQNAPYAHISWSTWKDNFKLGFALDNDSFSQNLFGHPYQGGLYFNAARSMGMNFWTSIPYVFGGSLMWEYLGENTRPSTDDLIYTTIGGTYIGEFTYRMSSQVLDDTATGGNRFWRELLGLVLDPTREVNRILSGAAWRTSSTNGQTHEDLTGNLSLGAVFFDEHPDLPKAKASGALGLDFQYGDWCQCVKAYNPFDLIAFDGTARYGNKFYLQLSTYAPLFAVQRENAKGQRLLYGLFQDYDYIKNEGLEIGGVAFTGGVLATLPLSPRSTFQAAAQAGSVVWGGSDNIYVHVEDRDYNYEMGPVFKLESSVTVQGLGGLTVRAAHYQLFTVGGAPTVADRSHDMLTYLKARADVHVYGKTGLRFEYTAFFRHMHFNDHPEFTHYYYQFQGDLVFGF